MSGAVRQRILDVPEATGFFFAGDFQVRDGGAQHRVPVHQPFAAINQALLVQRDEHIQHDGRHFVVHREIFLRPVDGRAQAVHLPRDGRAGFLFPFPDAFLELLLHHDLRGDPCVVRSR